MKRVLHNRIGVDLIHLLQHGICCGLDERGQQNKLGAYSCLAKIPTMSRMARDIPVAVKRMFILNVSPEITCAPELDPVGERRLVMA